MAENKQEMIVATTEDLEAKLAEVREAQKIFATYSQEKVDQIFKAAAMAANRAKFSWLLHLLLTRQEFLLQRWQLKKQAWALLRIR